jgi:5-methylcytosine-specific restriction protein A
MRHEFPAKVKLAAWERCGGRCEKCTRKLYPGDIHHDHRVPDSMGGEPILDNCQVLCRSCHCNKTSIEDIPAIAKGKRIRRKHLSIRGPRKFRGWRRFDGSVKWAR